MCTLIAVDFKTRAFERITSTDLRKNGRSGEIEVISLVEEWHERISCATDPDADDEDRLQVGEAILNELKVFLGDIKALSGAVILDGSVPAEVANEISAMETGCLSDVYKGFVSVDAILYQARAVKVLTVAQKAGVRIRSDYPSIRKLFSPSVKILPIRRWIPEKRWQA